MNLAMGKALQDQKWKPEAEKKDFRSEKNTSSIFSEHSRNHR